MAQVNWVFLDTQGGRHQIGLYHGDRSGHLLLHCNRSVVQIDFSVKADKTYSFFIEEELVEIHLRREANGFFSYEFVLNETADTPRNRIRRVENKRNLRYTAYTIAGMALFALILIAFGRFQERRRIGESSIASQREIPPELAAEGRTSFAYFYVFDAGSDRKARYSFKTRDSVTVSGLLELPDEGLVLLPTGFPLADNDAFSVLYLPQNPKVHRIDFNLPERKTIIRYVQTALASEVRAHPEQKPEEALCFLETLVDQKGWHTLADVLHQEDSASEHSRFNRDSYRQLRADSALITSVRQRCNEQEPLQ